MPSDFFTQLGRDVAAAVANLGSRAHLERIMRSGLDAHIGGDMARDAMPSGLGARSQMPSYGDQDPSEPNGGEEPSEVDTCVATLQHWLANVPPELRDELVGKLHQLITAAHANGGNGNGGEYAGVGDQMPMNNVRSGNRAAMDAQFAARARRTQSFQARFPYVDVQLSGGGSRR